MGNSKKTLIGVLTALVGMGGITVAGITLDRPAMLSEVQVVASQSVENKISILFMRRYDIQEQIWLIEDRIEAKGMTPERKERLRELRVRYKNIDDMIKKATAAQ